MYDCSGCPGPNIHIAADGQVHPISGWPFDAESVTVVDPRTITITMKKGGRTVGEEIWTVSEDGKTLTFKSTDYPPEGHRPVTNDATFTKVGNAPAGSHATSRSWSVNVTGIKANENGWWTYRSTGDSITMSSPTGVAYDVKLDGHDYPV